MRALSLAAILVVSLGAAAGCAGPAPGADDTPSAADPPDARSAGEGGGAAREDDRGHVHHEALSAAGTRAGSLYALDSEWRDQSGRTMRLADLAGRPRVVALVYTHCSYACPAIVARMKRIEATVTGAPPDQGPGFVLVSIDPDRDTPERLATFAQDAGLDPARWTLLNGEDGQVRELSVLLGVPYKAVPGGEFTHANVLTVLDEAGVPVTRLEGLDSDLGRILRALAGLAGV
jgi:protein SCO1/2